MQNEDIKTLRQICADMDVKGTSIEDPNFSNRNAALFGILTLKITAAQVVTLAKAAKFGWKFTKVYWNDTSVALVIATTTNVAIVYPDGSMDRAPHNKSRVHLDQAKWKSSTQDQSSEV